MGHFFDQVSTLVDDGSDHDHDSHIMVWQVRDKQDSNPEPAPSNLDPPTNKLEVESRSSRGSSSTVDLGPAPGSGLTTSENSDAEQKFERQASLGLEMTESMTTSSLLQFNRDVESLMENSNPEPNEDFTQHFNT